jgi:hypothetical protein
MPSSRLYSCLPLASQASQPLGREGLESSLLGMRKAWGLVVDDYRAACAHVDVLTHTLRTRGKAWGKAYRLMPSLYQKSTQLLHGLKTISVSVNPDLYTLSTPPIKTTTNYMKGF